MKSKQPGPAEAGHLINKFPSEIPAGEIRRVVSDRQLPHSEIKKLLCLGGRPNKKNGGVSYWLPVPEEADSNWVQNTLSGLPKAKPTFLRFTTGLKDKFPKGTIAILDYSPAAKSILPEKNEILRNVLEFLKPKEVEHICNGLPVFQTSDFANGWGAEEATINGFIYRGDLGQQPKKHLHALLRSKYPNCLINGR